MPSIEVRVIDSYIYNYSENSIKFLVLKRNNNRIYEHLWQGVAGKIEKGEKAWQAAIRELKEETGLEPFRMFSVDHVSIFYEGHKDRMNLVPVFGIEVKSDRVILSDEHIDFQWLEYKEAYNRLPWSGQKEGLNMVYQMAISKDDERMIWSEINLNK